MIEFTENEIKAMQSLPDALEVLADHHSVQETMADAIGEPFDECVKHHKRRRIELRTEATRIRATYED